MQLNPANLNRLSPPINWLLALVIGFVLAKLTLDLLPHYMQVKAPVEIAAETPAPRVSIQGISQQIVQAHLFGRFQIAPVEKVAPPPPPPPKPEVTAAPVTRLNLSLYGVLAAEPVDNALAIISANSKPEAVYAVGDQIVGDATLQSVHRDYVVIGRPSGDELLYLEKKKGAQNAATATAAAAPKPTTPAPAEPEPATQQAAAEQEEALPTSAGELRQRILKNPAMLSELITIRRYQSNGKLAGFRIQPKKNPELLANFGIQPGDVITSINGVSLTDPQKGFTALSGLRTAKNIDLIVLRAGQELPISVSLE